jgi:hypothetical protein
VIDDGGVEAVKDWEKVKEDEKKKIEEEQN